MSTTEPGPVGANPPVHPCQVGLLVESLGAWLAGADAPLHERREVACRAIRAARPDFEAFARSRREPHAVVAVELEVRRGAELGAELYDRMPGPVTLLLACAPLCSTGDVVVLRQRTADGRVTERRGKWPLAPADAEVMTRPIDR